MYEAANIHSYSFHCSLRDATGFLAYGLSSAFDANLWRRQGGYSTT